MVWCIGKNLFQLLLIYYYGRGYFIYYINFAKTNSMNNKLKFVLIAITATMIGGVCAGVFVGVLGLYKE